MEYNIVLQWRAGAENLMPGALSRLPLRTDAERINIGDSFSDDPLSYSSTHDAGLRGPTLDNIVLRIFHLTSVDMQMCPIAALFSTAQSVLRVNTGTTHPVHRRSTQTCSSSPRPLISTPAPRAHFTDFTDDAHLGSVCGCSIVCIKKLKFPAERFSCQSRARYNGLRLCSRCWRVPGSSDAQLFQHLS